MGWYQTFRDVCKIHIWLYTIFNKFVYKWHTMYTMYTMEIIFNSCISLNQVSWLKERGNRSASLGKPVSLRIQASFKYQSCWKGKYADEPQKQQGAGAQIPPELWRAWPASWAPWGLPVTAFGRWSGNRAEDSLLFSCPMEGGHLPVKGLFFFLSK